MRAPAARLCGRRWRCPAGPLCRWHDAASSRASDGVRFAVGPGHFGFGARFSGHFGVTLTARLRPSSLIARSPALAACRLAGQMSLPRSQAAGSLDPPAGAGAGMGSPAEGEAPRSCPGALCVFVGAQLKVRAPFQKKPKIRQSRNPTSRQHSKPSILCRNALDLLDALTTYA
jgi:hypothetical protein